MRTNKEKMFWLQKHESGNFYGQVVKNSKAQSGKGSVGQIQDLQNIGAKYLNIWMPSAF